MSYDVIVIGSGFGGAVVALRMAEKGAKVLVLERGRHWTIDPTWSGPDDWFFDPNDPASHNGWFDFRALGRMSTIAAAGVGGGSLHYSNVSIDAPPDTFDTGWPAAINHATLAPYYARVTATLAPGEVPSRQEPEKLKILKNAAEGLGYGGQFRKVDLAVTFKPDWDYNSTEPPPDPETVTLTDNAFGVKQGWCIHLGVCVLGCKVRARNMLDYNYLAQARQKGAEIRPLHLVRRIRLDGQGYVVDYDQITGKGLVAGSVGALVVVVSAGSIGTTELLLRCRGEHRTLTNLSPMVGRQWSCNTNYLTLVDHPGVDVYPTRGPNITGAVGFFGPQKHMGASVNIEDGGIPPNLGPLQPGRPREGLAANDLLVALHEALGTDSLFRHQMPWFSQGRDESTGSLSLRRRWLLFGEKILHLSWDPGSADGAMAAIIDLHERMARKTGGNPQPSLWPLLRSLVSPHPLGGCPMGETPSQGVVNDKGEVFGYSGLYVADGSLLPRAIGLNPSKTIAALSERIAEGIRS